MKTQLILLVFAILCSSSLHAQVQNEVKEVLATKDYVAFKNYADKLTNKENRTSGRWLCLRDITTDFQEGVFIFEKSVQDSINPAIGRISTFHINFISTKTNIVQYELSEKKYEKVGNEKEYYFETIDKYKDDSSFNIFKSSFKDLYQLDLNESDLFVTDFVYGSRCGYAGSITDGREQMDEWVLAKNKKEILTWLKSANTEKQVYAVEGLTQLKKSGVKLTKDEIKLINFVCDKNGTIYVCGGCIHSVQEIRMIAEAFIQEE